MRQKSMTGIFSDLAKIRRERVQERMTHAIYGQSKRGVTHKTPTSFAESAEAAETERARIAALNPGKTFIIREI